MDALLEPSEDGMASVLLTNTSGFTCRVEAGSTIGTAADVSILELAAPAGDTTASVYRVPSSGEVPPASGEKARKEKLLEANVLPELPEAEKEQLQGFLEKHHLAFCLEPGERGETDLVQFQIDTADSSPQRQPARRLPFAVRREVAKQLETMRKEGVIVPSKSPWASPVVLVRKKDGSHRFCVDYRKLNSVTKADTFPLPRIDDLLDQLGKSKYSTTLDMASGYWQIRVHPDSQEKTALVTPQGLYEFRVMPFSLCNAPAVFQRLMQVLQGLTLQKD